MSFFTQEIKLIIGKHNNTMLMDQPNKHEKYTKTQVFEKKQILHTLSAHNHKHNRSIKQTKYGKLEYNSKFMKISKLGLMDHYRCARSKKGKHNHSHNLSTRKITRQHLVRPMMITDGISQTVISCSAFHQCYT